jgi:hypothetical protein
MMDYRQSVSWSLFAWGIRTTLVKACDVLTPGQASLLALCNCERYPQVRGLSITAGPFS